MLCVVVVSCWWLCICGLSVVGVVCFLLMCAFDVVFLFDICFVGGVLCRCSSFVVCCSL